MHNQEVEGGGLKERKREEEAFVVLSLPSSFPQASNALEIEGHVLNTTVECQSKRKMLSGT